jgi:NADH-quinone oxidoreductase subunit M
VAFFAATGVILSAGYALWLYRRVVFGNIEKPSLAHITDMTPREAAALIPLIILTILFGVFPSPILDVFGASVESLMAGVQKSLAAAGSITAAGL